MGIIYHGVRSKENRTSIAWVDRKPNRNGIYRKICIAWFTVDGDRVERVETKLRVRRWSIFVRYEQILPAV